MDTHPEPPPKPRRRWRRRLLIVGGALLIVLAALIGFAPAIASGLAPGIIQSAVNKQIPGRVKVNTVRVGWSGPITVGPVELLDDHGNRVGEVSASIGAGAWKIVTGRWWSASNIDLGVAELSGSLNVVRSADGTTNLEHAISRAPSTPRAPSAPKSASSSARSVTGDIRLASLDISYTDASAAPGSPAATGIRLSKFGGDAKLSYAQRATASTPSLALKADFSGDVSTGPAAAPAPSAGKVRLIADGTANQDAAGSLEHVDGKIDLTGAPIDLVDGLAGFAGDLSRAIGPQAEVHLAANGNLKGASIVIGVSSEGSKINADMAYNGGVLSVTKPARVWLRSTEFVRGIPAARQRLAAMSDQFTLDSWPSLDIAVDAFKLPLPGPGAANVALKDLDLRAASMQATATLGAASGKVAQTQTRTSAGLAPGPGAAPAPASRAPLSPYKLDPLEIRLDGADFTKPISLTAHTKAEVDGRSAGTLALSANAAGFLDEQGHASLASIKGARATVELKGASTALLQPILDATGMHIDAPQDIGPTLDMQVAASSAGNPADVGAAGSKIDGTLSLASSNINADGAFRLDNSVLSTTGDGLRIRAASTTPLLARIIAASKSAAGSGPSLTITGPGRVLVTVTNLAVPIKDKVDFAQTPGRVDVQVEALGVAVTGSLPAGSGPPGPLSIDRLGVRADLAPGKPPTVTLTGAMTHEGSPFTLSGLLAVPGAFAPSPAGVPNAGSPIDSLVRYSPRGRIDLKKVPRSLTRLAPALESQLAPGDAHDVQAEVKRLLSAVLGQEIDVALILDAPADSKAGERATLDVHSAEAGVYVEAAIRPDAVDLLAGVVSTDLKPTQVNPVLAALSAPAPKPAAPKPGATTPGAPGGGATTPMTLASPVTIRLAADPITIPLVTNGSSIQPQLDRAPDARFKVTTSGPVEMSGIPIGDGSMSAALADLDASVKLPLAMFVGPVSGADKSPARPIQGALAANLMPSITGPRPDSHAQPPIKAARVEAEGTLVPGTMERSVSARLIDVDTGAVDTILGKPGFTAGALDKKVQVTLRAVQHAPASNAPGAQPSASLEANIASSRISGGTIKGAMADGAIHLTDPVRLTWTPTVEWVNQYMLTPPPAPASPTKAGIPPNPAPAGKDAGPGATTTPTRLASETTFTLDIKKLSLAVPRARSTDVGPQAAPAQGLFKPGVFGLDASISAPHAQTVSSEGTGLNFDDIRLNASSGRDNTITLDMSVASVGAQNAPGKPGAPSPKSARSLLHAVVTNFTDKDGFPTPDSAVLNANADLSGVPTPLLDRLSGEKGLLTYALGSSVNLKATAQNLSASGGNLNVQADSPRATGAVQGSVRDKAFRQGGPVSVRIVEIVPELVSTMVGFPPTIASIEKKKTDEPGTITAEGLVVPTDGDKSKLNGTITVDLGTASFALEQDIVSSLLKAIDQKQKGTVGRRVQPFVVHIKDGVITYDRFRLPVGEFDIETQGTVDLVHDHVEVVTYVPLFALTDEAAGLFNTGIAGKLGAIDRNTLMPITTKGTLKKHKTEVDLPRFLKETGGNIVDQPGKIIDDILNIGKKKPKK